jgi:hypothetical protein
LAVDVDEGDATWLAVTAAEGVGFAATSRCSPWAMRKPPVARTATRVKPRLGLEKPPAISPGLMRSERGVPVDLGPPLPFIVLFSTPPAPSRHEVRRPVVIRCRSRAVIASCLGVCVYGRGALISVAILPGGLPDDPIPRLSPDHLRLARESIAWAV